MNVEFDFLSRLLDVADLRHRVLASNIANVNTPGYHRQEVRFEEFLAGSLHKGQGIASVEPQVVDAHEATAREDGNTVDIDSEMGRLNKNTVLYLVFGQVLSGQIATMRAAITGKQV